MFLFLFVFEKKCHRIRICILKMGKLAFVFLIEKTYFNPTLNGLPVCCGIVLT